MKGNLLYGFFADQLDSDFRKFKCNQFLLYTYTLLRTVYKIKSRIVETFCRLDGTLLQIIQDDKGKNKHDSQAETFRVN